MDSWKYPYNCNVSGVLYRRKWYVVTIGCVPGIYLTWEETEPQVDGYNGARHKSF